MRLRSIEHHSRIRAHRELKRFIPRKNKHAFHDPPPGSSIFRALRPSRPEICWITRSPFSSPDMETVLGLHGASTSRILLHTERLYHKLKPGQQAPKASIIVTGHSYRQTDMIVGFCPVLSIPTKTLDESFKSCGICRFLIIRAYSSDQRFELPYAYSPGYPVFSNR